MSNTIVKKIQFNTGRKYTSEGQRIVALLWDDDMVTFMDHDRMIGGEFKMPLHCRLDQTEVMHWYDAPGGYQMSSRAMSKDHAWEGK